MTVPASWRNSKDEPSVRPAVPGPKDTPFYQAIGAFQAETYERNAFAQHTEHEVAWLLAELQLTRGMRLLDVGCGTGRHMRRLAQDGIETVGIDVSDALLAAGRALPHGTDVTFHLGDAATVLRGLPVTEGFDAVISLHQGALGISPDGDIGVVTAAVEHLKPSGVFVATFFHALFAARHLVGDDAYDPMNGVHHQRAEVYGIDRQRQHFDLWTTAYTVREAVALLRACGLHVRDVHGVEPGAFTKRGPFEVGLDDPEFVVVATR